MIKKPSLTIVLTALFSLFSHSLWALDKANLIEARQGHMKLYAINMEILDDMISGRIPYNRKQAQAAANNLFSLTQMNNGALWPLGSSLAEPGLQNKTRAKPDTWRNVQDVALWHKDLEQAAEILAKNAGWSVDSLEDSFDGVSAACDGCHEDYRAKKK